MSVNNQIAIIGVGCRLPGDADDPESLWSLLAEGRNGHKDVPIDRWDWKSFYHPDPDHGGTINTKSGHFLNYDISAFDARFFGIQKNEATGIDPQQRFLLEVTYEAIENAGIPVENLRGSNTSVHMAIFAKDYNRMGYKDIPQTHKSHITGAGEAILANRISYILDLKGASTTYDTGCSGSLVALHEACRTLRADESTIALAGSSQLLLTPDEGLAAAQMRFTNKDGKCYAFDDRGEGYGRGEGQGVLVLKRLDRALADGDAIQAVIMDSGVGQDGKTAGIFMPNTDAQESLARSVYARAGLDPLETLYVEAHGTGTVAGDNAEIQSICKVFGREAGRKSDLPVGSIKANIGHLEAASGMAGVIKAIMILKKNQVPPQCNFINPKPTLHLEERGIKIPLRLMPLTPDSHVGPRRVSVNSFGYGGTNAHVILQAYDHAPIANGHSNHSNSNGIDNGDRQHRGTEKTLVALSANSEKSLRNMVVKLRRWLESDSGHRTSFADLAYTLNVRRSKLPWRCSVVARDSQELERALGDSKLRYVKSENGAGIAFIFTGQGSQWFAMGRELLTTARVFASSVESCTKIIKYLGCDWDIHEELSRDKETTRLGDAKFSQPCTTAVQIALVDLLESYGIRPDTVCGHSSGEIAAAYAAGALSKEAAMKVSYKRGVWSAVAKSLNETSGGMLAVGEGEEAINKRIKSIPRGKGKVTVACVNSPESTTISGDVAAIEALQAILDTASVFNRRLQVDSAYHSHHMEVVAQDYFSSMNGMAHGKVRKNVAFYSSVTGTGKLSDFGPSYWVSNLVSQVKFSVASRLVAEHLSTKASHVLVEVGPHSSLAGPLRQSLSDFRISGDSFKYIYVPTLVRNENAVSSVLTLIGRAFEAGCPVQVDAMLGGNNVGSSSRYRVVDNLPTYAWERSSYWHESRLSKDYRLRPFPSHDLVGLVDVGGSLNEPRWRHLISVRALPWLRDHVIEGQVIFPGAGYLAMVTEAMKQIFQLRKTPGHFKVINFRNVIFAKALVIPGEGQIETQLTLSPSRQHAGSPWEYFRVLSYDSQNDSWIEHCNGAAAIESDFIKSHSQLDEVDGTVVDGLGHLTMAAAVEMLEYCRANSPIQVDPTEEYNQLSAAGNTYGPCFQGLKEIHVGKRCVVARIVVHDVAKEMPEQFLQPHTIHPTTSDVMFQALGPVFARREFSNAASMPVSIAEMSISADIDTTPGAEILAAGELFLEGRRSASGNVCAYQQNKGKLVPVLTIKASRAQVVGEVNSTNSIKQKMSYRLEYKPDVDHTTQSDFVDCAGYMQAFVHKYPKTKFLEIGTTDNGSATMALMESIERNKRLLLDTYTYTNISDDFEHARNNFGKWPGQIEFRTLDISSDLLAQNYADHTFDVIIASSAFYATPPIQTAITNVRKLLKPGGRLILTEREQIAHNVLRSEWDNVLKNNGFSGTDFVLQAHYPSTIGSVIVSKVIDVNCSLDIRDPAPVMEMKASICLGHSDLSQAASGDAIRLSLVKKGVACSQQAWGIMETENNADRLAIVIDSAEHPLLINPSQEAFEHIKRLMLQGKDVLWISFQNSPPSAEMTATKNMVNGLARVIRRESPGLRLVTVDVQDQVQFSGSKSGSCALELRVVQALTEIAMSSFWPVSESMRAEELEYAIFDGKMTVPRIVPDDCFANYLASQYQDQDETSLVECRYLDIDRPVMFDVRVPGLLNTIRFVDNTIMTEPLDPDQVEMKAYAHGVNFKDVFIALGQMQPGTEMSGEIAGVITKVGSNFQSLWKPGDRVVGTMVPPFGNLVRLKAIGIAAIPDSISFTDAATVPVVFSTAWHCLTQAARLEKSQTVLIHAGSGGVGQAAIQIAKFIGAEIFTTVGSASKRKLIQDQYGIPESHIFSYRRFKKSIMHLTRDKGVDVVLNSLSGEMLMDSWDCLAQFGTFCEIGKADMYGHSQLNMANFEKHATFAAVDVSYLYRKRTEFAIRALVEIFSMMDKGLLKPVYPITTYPIGRMEEAFRLIAARKHVGKLVLVADEQTMVQATRPKPPPLRLQHEGTYVIGGGLGDLGQRMGRFLVEHGAGHVVALSRRNVDSEQRASLEKSFSELGGKLHIVKCDISNEENTRAAAKEIAALPPVRGIIQSTLVIRDHPWEYMELEDWDAALSPKVHGTKNMHKVFCSPETTDFFIMLSSVAGIIGSPSQSNYAAGNAFQDAFAHGPHTQGGITHYTAMNVGAVEGSKQIALALSHSDMVRSLGVVTFDEVLTTLEYAIGPQGRLDEAVQCIMPFDRDGMEDAMGPTSGHLFDHVPGKKSQEETNAVNNKKPSVIQVVERAESVEEAQDIVKDALLKKFASFIGEDVPADQPVISIGIDSLVSIELKNWIKHNFSMPIQTSELIGAKSIIALAKLIVSRMDLKCKDKVQAAETEEKDARKSEAKPSSAEMTLATAKPSTKPHHGFDCCKLNEELPVYPLPDLDKALASWLEMNGHHYSSKQLELIQMDIDSMRARDSPARRILQELLETHKDDKSNAWYSEIFADAHWFSDRSPIAPFRATIVFGTFRDGKKSQSQAERAAIISSSALSFKRAMKAGDIAPLRFGGKAECTWRWKFFFNSVRMPQIGCDKIVCYDSDGQSTRDHIAVLMRGHVFKVMLHDDQGKEISFKELEATFEAIAARAEDDILWPGILTADDRDSWALTREKLLLLSPANIEYFHVVETSLLVLCLDDCSPETTEQRVRQCYLGSNRWFDKTVQIYVAANGSSGLLAEHGALDGATAGRLVQWIVSAIDEYFPNSSNGQDKLNSNPSSKIVLDEVVLQMTPEIETRINVLRNRFAEDISAATYVQEHLTEFGIDFLSQNRVPIKAVVDITFQLALRFFFGRNVPCWEPNSLGHYHNGRADQVQKATLPVVAFCQAVTEACQDEDQIQHGATARLAAMLSSTTQHMNQINANVHVASNRLSYFQVLEILRFLWPADADIPRPRFLTDRIYDGGLFPHQIFAQSNGVETEKYCEDVANSLTPEGFWAFMYPEKNEISVMLWGGAPERTAAFVKQLHRAARIVRDIVGGGALLRE